MRTRGIDSEPSDSLRNPVCRNVRLPVELADRDDPRRLFAHCMTVVAVPGLRLITFTPFGESSLWTVRIRLSSGAFVAQSCDQPSYAAVAEPD